MAVILSKLGGEGRGESPAVLPEDAELVTDCDVLVRAVYPKGNSSQSVLSCCVGQCQTECTHSEDRVDEAQPLGGSDWLGGKVLRFTR